MRSSFIFSLFMIIFLLGSCQDGGNINYYESFELDDSFIGKQCHIDFGENSFGGIVVDTMMIYVKGERMYFYEHREDNGFNNWFVNQYLVSVEFPDVIRLADTSIDSISNEELYVTSALSYYSGEHILDTITVFSHSYNMKDISQILILE